MRNRVLKTTRPCSRYVAALKTLTLLVVCVLASSGGGAADPSFYERLTPMDAADILRLSNVADVGSKAQFVKRSGPPMIVIIKDQDSPTALSIRTLLVALPDHFNYPDNIVELTVDKLASTKLNLENVAIIYIRNGSALESPSEELVEIFPDDFLRMITAGFQTTKQPTDTSPCQFSVRIDSSLYIETTFVIITQGDPDPAKICAKDSLTYSLGLLKYSSFTALDPSFQVQYPSILINPRETGDFSDLDLFLLEAAYEASVNHSRHPKPQLVLFFGNKWDEYFGFE